MRFTAPCGHPTGAASRSRGGDPYLRGLLEVWLMESDGSNPRRIVTDIGATEVAAQPGIPGGSRASRHLPR